MPNFKKNDGFALGGSPFTMKKGSKELDTEGSFRQEAMGKMGSYGSPLFAIEGRQGRGDGSQVDTTSDLGADVEAGLAQGKAIAGELGLDDDEDEPSMDQERQQTLDTLGSQKKEMDKTNPLEVKPIQLQN
jgi:hypothetical protein